MKIVMDTLGKEKMRKNKDRFHGFKAHSRILVLFSAILSVFFVLTITNELLDVPHYLFGDAPTSWGQRKGEVILEAVTYAVVVIIAFYYYNRLRRRITILEGLLPICANCKRIRQDL